MGMMEINRNPDRRSLRVFGVGAVAFFGVLAAWAYLRHSLFGFGFSEVTAHGAAAVLAIHALVCAVLAAAFPQRLRRLYIAMSVAALPIGWVLSFLVLAAIYYAVLTPIGLAMRLLGHDPLQRKFDPQATSYWLKRERPDDVKRYFRQF